MFPSTPFTAIREHGAIPFFSWNSAASDGGINQPDFQLADVADGRYDAYIKQWAASAARWGHPFFLRFNWEMNGDWFPWSEGVNGNARGTYVAAWRHVHDLFASVGARNATWVWCPNIDPDGRYTALEGLYPGDAYVDWTCIDGYSHEPGNPGRSFKSIFRSVYDEVTRIAPNKPMVIGETGAVQSSRKPAWLAGMFQALADMPAVKAFMYFENIENPGNIDWSVATSPAAQSAFRTGINDPAFLENDFGDIDASPIGAP